MWELIQSRLPETTDLYQEVHMSNGLRQPVYSAEHQEAVSKSVVAYCICSSLFKKNRRDLRFPMVFDQPQTNPVSSQAYKITWCVLVIS